MSAATQKQYGDLQHSTSTFSYAQAAKGRSPSVPSTLTAGKTLSDTADIDGKRASSSSMESSKEPIKRTVSESRTPQDKEMKFGQEDHSTQSSDPKSTVQTAAQDTTPEIAQMEPLSDKPAVVGQSQAVASAPSSPEYGTTSTSTLPKEDDVFSTTNGSSDSTSDKQSQTSQNGNKSHEKADVEKGNAAAPWDEEAPVPVPTLKEAAPPPINVWQIRSQNQAKSRSTNPSQSTKPVNLAGAPVIPNGQGKGNEASHELKKQDGRKKPKAVSGVTEDRSASGSGKDVAKSVDSAEKSGAVPIAPPPPPGDANSWPKPDSAAGDGKKKSSDRVEKTEKDTPVPKPHGKEKWVPVPYVPTAVFNTPLPATRRGGRGAPRGGREGESRGRHTTTNGNGFDKSTVAGAANGQIPPANGQDRGRATLTTTSTNPTSSKPKRASSAGPPAPRDQRKSGDLPGSEKRKASDAGTSKAVATNNNTGNTFRRPSVPTMAKDSQLLRPSSSAQGTEVSLSSTIAEQNKDGDKNLQNDVSEPIGQSRAGGNERRPERSHRSPDMGRDFQAALPIRERGEVRADRGRGGFRGRGGGNHAYFGSNVPTGHGFSNGYTPQYQSSSASPSKQHSNHDRLPPQAQGPPFQSNHHHTRHYRNNSRSQSIPHSTQYSRFANGQHGGPPHLANLQTDLANEYSYLSPHQGAMTAMPFHSYGEHQSVFGMVNLQMNYYFSVENLCKDMYLRSHMDSQGFVFLELLAQFNRIKQLTNDMELIRSACHHSQIIEYVNIDGIDRVRAREGWQQWVRKMEERDPSAQSDGPSLQSLPQYPQPVNYNRAFEDHQIVSPRPNAIENTMDSIQYQPLNGMTPPFGPNPNMAESNGIDASSSKTPISAAVSEFSPSARSTNSRNHTTTDHHAQGTSVFTDAQVDNLRILVRKPLHAAASMAPPFHSASSRTFSNGSIDGRLVNDELSKLAERQAKPMMNGDPSER